MESDVKIETIRQAGVSRSGSRWIANPLRRLIWPVMKHYFAAVLDGMQERARELESRDQELSAEVAGLAAEFDGLTKDNLAISHRIASFEEEMERMRHLPEFSGRPDLLYRHCSFSQCGEDRIAFYIFERLRISSKDVHYLDIGAAIPIDHNNTYLFYIGGGSGVLLEADPKYQQDYEKFRPRDQVGHFAVVPERLMGAGSIDFHLAVDQGWSSVDLEHVKEAERLGKGGVRETITVPTITIGKVLNRYFENETLHLLSLDIEGFDSEVIAEMDFEKFRPLVIIIESPNQSATGEFLIGKQYKPYASTFINQIFVRNDMFEKLVKAM